MCRSSLKAATLLLLLFATVQHAASDEPETVIPWLRDGGAGSGDVIAPSPEPSLPGSPDNTDAASAAQEDVATELAAAVIGVDRLPALGKGASPEVWEGSSHEDIANAIRNTRSTPFRAANLLLRELLSTPVDRSTTPLANDRAVALLRMGALPEALATAHAAASPTAAVLDTITRAALLYGHGATACSHARLDRDAVTIPGAAGVFCEAVHGSAAVASLRLELEQELGDIGPVEAGLLDAVIHPELKVFAPQPDMDAGLSDIAAGLVGHLDLPFPEGFLRNAPERQIWRFVDETDTPNPDRSLAMARLEAAGLLDIMSFRAAILRGNPDPSDELGVWTALLLHMADTRDPALFGRLIEASLKLGRRQGREAQAARLVSLPARRRTPGATSDILPSVMRRAFLLAGDPDSALLWLDLPARPETSMLFTIALQEFDASWDSADEEELAARFTEERDLRGGHVLAALHAFGASRLATPFEWQQTAESASVVTGSGDAEIALLALNRLAEETGNPGVLLAVLRALVTAGFEERARQIAIEVILLGS